MSVRVSVCVCLSVCLSVCVHDNSKNNGSIHLKPEHIVVYEKSSEEFDIGHFPIKVKFTARFGHVLLFNFSLLLHYFVDQL